MAARKGLEPPTSGLGNRCSILLSYRAATGALIAEAARFANRGLRRREQSKTPGGEAGRSQSGARGWAQAALFNDLVSMATAASRSMASMAATSRAIRSMADSNSWRSE